MSVDKIHLCHAVPRDIYQENNVAVAKSYLYRLIEKMEISGDTSTYPSQSIYHKSR